MNDMFKLVLVIMSILFVISMVNVIIYTYRKRKRWGGRNKTISRDGYMKMYMQIENGRGEIFVGSVDDMPPLCSSEVIQKAIFLAPGEHKIRLTAKVKDNSIAENVLPYHRNLGPFEITVSAKMNGIATLYLNADTQNMYVKESEET